MAKIHSHGTFVQEGVLYACQYTVPIGAVRRNKDAVSLSGGEIRWHASRVMSETLNWRKKVPDR